ncbi:MAG: hypothetical protein JSS53_09910 [Proteobacteria bacterium]|nr:hypothetical protein [Pseudomonadota bacterium]
MPAANNFIKKIWTGCAVSIVILAVFLAIARAVLPLIRLEKSAIEDFTTRLLKQPVTITQVRADWYHLEPLLELSDVTVFNKNRTHPLLKLKKLHLGFNILESLIYWRLIPRMIIASGGTMTIHERTDGHIEFDGISGLQTNIKSLNQLNEVSDLLDWLSAEEKIALRDVSIHWLGQDNTVFPMKDLNFFLVNKGDRHQLAGSTKLSQTIPSQLHFVFDFTGSMNDPKTWQGQFYLSAKDFLIAQWWKRFAETTWDITTGLVNCEIWANVKNGIIEQVQSTLDVQNMNIQDLKNLDTLLIQQLKANLKWEKQPQGWWLSGDKINLRVKGFSWPEFSFGYLFKKFKPDLEEHGLFMSYLKIEDVLPWILRNFKVDDGVKKNILPFQFKGVLTQFNLLLEKTTAKINHWSVQTGFNHLDWETHESWPGVKGLSGQLHVNPENGSLELDSKALVFDFDRPFKKKLDLSALILKLDWSHQNKIWTWNGSNYAIHRDKDYLSGKFNLIIPENKDNTSLDLTSSFSFSSIRKYFGYLSEAYMSPKLIKWLRKNILHEEGMLGQMSLHGKLKDFPFEKTKGEFDLTTNLNNFTFTYFPGWPAIKNLSANLQFKKLDLKGQVMSGESVGLPLAGFTFHDPKVGEADEYLFILGKMNTTLSTIKNYLLSVHAKEQFKLLKRLNFEGPAKVSLDLKIPIQEDMSGLKTDGIVEFINSSMGIEKEKIELYKLNGKLSFTKDGISGKDLSGELLGEKVQMSVQSNSDRQIPTQIDLLGKVSIDNLKKQWPNFLFDYFKGSTDYSAELYLHSDEQHPDKFFVHSDLKGIEIQLPEPFGKSSDSTENFESKITLPANQDPRFEFQFADILKLSGKNTFWVGELNDQNAVGRFEISSFENTSKVKLRFSHLYLDPDLFEDSTYQFKPEKIPFLDVIIDDLHYGNKQFGQFTFQSAPALHKMNITVLNATSPSFNLQTKGEWRSLGNYSETFLIGTLNSKNLSNTLQSWDIKPAIESDKTTLDLKLFWPGAPYDFSTKNLSGDLNIQLGRGRITKLDRSTQGKIGFAKLLDILSLQSIPRRLSLNFKDLTQSGFSFDKILGHFSLKKGEAETHDTIISGTVATVILNGRIGLAKEDYDFMMKVEPYLTGSIPVVAVIAGGPIAGAVAWVADKVVGKAISKAAATTYHVTGSWEQPIIKRVKRK